MKRWKKSDLPDTFLPIQTLIIWKKPPFLDGKVRAVNRMSRSFTHKVQQLLKMAISWYEDPLISVPHVVLPWKTINQQSPSCWGNYKSLSTANWVEVGTRFRPVHQYIPILSSCFRVYSERWKKGKQRWRWVATMVVLIKKFQHPRGFSVALLIWCLPIWFCNSFCSHGGFRMVMINLRTSILQLSLSHLNESNRHFSSFYIWDFFLVEVIEAAGGWSSLYEGRISECI